MVVVHVVMKLLLDDCVLRTLKLSDQSLLRRRALVYSFERTVPELIPVLGSQPACNQVTETVNPAAAAILSAPVSEMTYTVSSGTLIPTIIPYHTILSARAAVTSPPAEHRRPLAGTNTA